MAPHKPANPDRQIKLGDKDLTLRFSLRAIMALQDAWGLPDEEAVQERLKNPKNQLADFIDILWAATRTHHPELTRDEILSLADDAGLVGLGEAAQEAISASMPPLEASAGGGNRGKAEKKSR